MPQTARIKSLPTALRMMKAMQAEDVERGEDYRRATRQALAELLEGRMDQLIDAHLERMAELGEADRRKASISRETVARCGRETSLSARARIAVIGSFPSGHAVKAFVAALPDDSLVVSGGAAGVDTGRRKPRGTEA